MKGNTVLICLLCFLAFAVGPGGAQASAPTPSFTISATNITMPSSGNGSIPITLTSVNGFAGTVVVGCMSPNPPAGVRKPYCDLPGPVASTYVLTANAKVTESIGISASAPLPPAAGRYPPGAGADASLALAGGLMLGFGLRRRRARWPALLFLALAMLIGTTGIGACGSGPETLTPGTYTYTLNASAQNYPTLSASTTVNVTVPPGIVSR